MRTARAKVSVFRTETHWSFYVPAFSLFGAVFLGGFKN
jgi:hypothetical protein